MKRLYDPDLLQREYYNPNKFSVRFEIMMEKEAYILGAEKDLGPGLAICPAGGFLYLPHGYYRVFGFGIPLGEPIALVMNFEKSMFIGNKTPSNIRGENQ